MRNMLAGMIVIIGGLFVVGISLVTVIAAYDKPKEVIETLSSTILPVVATWVGTVLAFYFSEKNFEAASRAQERLLGGRLSKPAIDHALPKSKMEFIEVADRKEALAMSLAKIRSRLTDLKFFRIPSWTQATELYTSCTSSRSTRSW